MFVVYFLDNVCISIAHVAGKDVKNLNISDTEK